MTILSLLKFPYKTRTHLRSFKKKFHIYSGEQLNWIQVILRLQESVIPAILPWVLLCGVYGFLVSFLYYLGEWSGLYKAATDGNKGIPNIFLSLNIVLSLLLVFRTNSANERFWESRKLWGL